MRLVLGECAWRGMGGVGGGVLGVEIWVGWFERSLLGRGEWRWPMGV